MLERLLASWGSASPWLIVIQFHQNLNPAVWSHNPGSWNLASNNPSALECWGHVDPSICCICCLNFEVVNCWVHNWTSNLQMLMTSSLQDSQTFVVGWNTMKHIFSNKRFRLLFKNFCLAFLSRIARIAFSVSCSFFIIFIFLFKLMD